MSSYTAIEGTIGYVRVTTTVDRYIYCNQIVLLFSIYVSKALDGVLTEDEVSYTKIFQDVKC